MTRCWEEDEWCSWKPVVLTSAYTQTHTECHCSLCVNLWSETAGILSTIFRTGCHGNRIDIKVTRLWWFCMCACVWTANTHSYIMGLMSSHCFNTMAVRRADDDITEVVSERRRNSARLFLYQWILGVVHWFVGHAVACCTLSSTRRPSVSLHAWWLTHTHADYGNTG